MGKPKLCKWAPKPTLHKKTAPLCSSLVSPLELYPCLPTSALFLIQPYFCYNQVSLLNPFFRNTRLWNTTPPPPPAPPDLELFVKSWYSLMWISSCRGLPLSPYVSLQCPDYKEWIHSKKTLLIPPLWLSEYCNSEPQETGISCCRRKSLKSWENLSAGERFTACQLTW